MKELKLSWGKILTVLGTIVVISSLFGFVNLENEKKVMDKLEVQLLDINRTFGSGNSISRSVANNLKIDERYGAAKTRIWIFLMLGVMLAGFGSWLLVTAGNSD